MANHQYLYQKLNWMPAGATKEAVGVKAPATQCSYSHWRFWPAFIGLGAIFCTTVLAGLGGANPVPYRIQRLLGGVVFCLGLILVIVGGAGCSPATTHRHGVANKRSRPRSCCATGASSTRATSLAP